MKALFMIVSMVSVAGLARAERESWGRQAALGVAVQFNSQGEGVDVTAFNAIYGIAADELKSGRADAIRQKNWGREGERNLCLSFTDATAAREVETAICRAVKASKDAQLTKFVGVTDCSDENGGLEQISASDLGC